MVKAILPDGDVQGQLARLIYVLQRREWLEFWQALQIPVASFADFGLLENAPDSRVWEVCQAQQLVLVTGNRNHEAPDSWEATIRKHNTEHSLPVLTLGDTRRVMHDADYAERAAIQMLDYLTNIEHFLGAGRLYLP